jgi:acyl transferase domain-containing protein/thioesterase domain-containing protein
VARRANRRSIRTKSDRRRAARFEPVSILAQAPFTSGRPEAAIRPIPMEVHASGGNDSTDIAIVGLAGRFPGADNAAAFWRNLREGVESIRHLEDDELRAAGVDAATFSDPNYVRRAAVFDGIDQFDAPFFGFSPKDAAILDPQHRQFLECAWEAFEDAAHTPEKFAGAIGVFAGCGMNAYFMFNLLTNPRLLQSVGLFLLRHTGNDKDFLTTRVSYCFNLTGPSVSVQTACSTSLVAIHTACQSLLSGECDMALAGGVTVELPHGRGYLYEEGEILSPDGHCRAFDEQARGTIFGSGVGVVVLRRLTDALADGDQIRAVIKGSAVNNDGSRKVSYLAPSVDGQAKAVSEALAVAGVSADSISYVEAHGTGTPVGDLIEIAALTQAFAAQTDRRGYCAIGSLKTNIGHLDTAAGVASLIKVVLALEHRQIPPSLNCERPNPAIAFENTPFTVNTRLTEWRTAGTPRRAGISSLGVGGTNVHAIVEEAPVRPAVRSAKSRHLMLLSAHSAEALDRAAHRLADFLDGDADGKSGLDLADVAFTLQAGRRRFSHRRALVCSDRADAVLGLRSVDPRRGTILAAREEAPPPVVFLFPGGGAQYPGMGADLYREEPVYRDALDKGMAWLRRRTGSDFASVLFPSEKDAALAAQALEQPSNSVLSVFMTGYALGQLWMSWGIRPAAMMGHSLGEYTAACLAGVLSLEDALMLVSVRGAIFERLPPGAMLGVELAESEVRPLLNPRLSIAAVNAPSLCIVSGPITDIDVFEREMATRGHDTQRLRIAVAAHSSMLDPYLAEFAAQLATIEMSPPTVPLISNGTGTWASAAELTEPQYWVRQLRGTVRFSQGLLTAVGERPPLFLEVGPGHSLSSLAKLHLGPAAASSVIPSMRHPQQSGSDLEALYGAAGRLWLRGHDLDWTAVHGARRSRISLPTYPFEHRRYWIEPGQAATPVMALEPVIPLSPATAEAPARLDDPGSWFWRPVWRKTPRSAARPLVAGGRWLVFDNGSTTAESLTRSLEQVYAQRVVTVAVGDRFTRRSDGVYAVRPGERDDYDALVAALTADGGVPVRVVHMWLAGALPETSRPGEGAQQLGFESLFYLAQALAAADLPGALTIDVVTDGMDCVADEPVGDPLQALAVGPALVIPHEFPDIACRLIDIAGRACGSGAGDVASELLGELISDASDARVALRGGQRWVWDLEPAPILESETIGDFPRAGATYLVTGGLSGIGLAVAARMADSAPVGLALLSRRGLPPRSSWEALLREAPDHSDAIAVRKIQQMEAAGARVLVLAADLIDPASVALAVASARQLFGRIDGVLHAAGVVEDAPMQMKARDSFERVLAPKVHGLLTLEAALRDAPPALLVLFSSTSGFLGLPGQVDYTAANAFLNAYARARNRASATRTVAVQWGVWRDVGMAARIVAPRPARSAAGQAAGAVRHPLLGRVVRHDASERVFEADFSVATHWIVSEHRLATGEAIVPGTAMIELARAAFLEVSGSNTVEIRELYFLEPLRVRDDESRLVQTRLRRDGDVWMLSVQSASADAWVEHARATLARLAHETPAPLDLATLPIDARPGTEAAAAILPALQAAHLDFGPRWRNIREMRTASGRCVTLCELPQEFRADLEAFKTHPALLDMGLSSGLAMLDARVDLYVPLSYDAIRVYGPIGSSIISVVTPVGDLSSTAELVEFNATVTDDAGVTLMEVQGFVMRRITAAVTARLRESVAPAPTGPVNPRLSALVQAGIGTDDGWRALLQVLNGTALAEIVVSSIDVNTLRASADGSISRARVAHAPKSGGDARGKTEDTAAAAITVMWQDLLGVDEVGLDDDFFELGGHSLIALRLVARIEKSFKKKLRLATLFEARTIRQLAAVVGERQTLNAWRSLVPIQPHGSKPPFFCVHGVGGEVLSYAALGSLCAPHQPFVAFRTPDENGPTAPMPTLEEQASLYIREMTAYQPDGPYYVGGYSHGGRVALEMALQLEAAGKEVAFLGIIDTWPQDVPQRSPQYVARWLRNLFLWAYYDARQTTTQANVDRLRRGSRTLRRRLARLAPWARTAGGVSIEDADVGEQINIDRLPADVQRVFRRNFAAFRRYRPRALCGPLTLLRAGIQPIFGPHQPDLGWGDVSRAPVHVRLIHGSHSSILEPPQVGQLAEELLAALGEAQAQAGTSSNDGGRPRGPGAPDLAGAPDPLISEVPPIRAATQRLSPSFLKP